MRFLDVFQFNNRLIPDQRSPGLTPGLKMSSKILIKTTTSRKIEAETETSYLPVSSALIKSQIRNLHSPFNPNTGSSAFLSDAEIMRLAVSLSLLGVALLFRRFSSLFSLNVSRNQ